jgi:integrase
MKPGIRQKTNGRFIATKSIDGKRFYKEFPALREAELWKNKFHPVLNKDATARKNAPASPSANGFLNGRDFEITVKEVYERYLLGPLKDLGAYQRYTKTNRMNRFLPPIFSVRLCELTPEVISNLLERHKLAADTTYGRCDFREELKHFKSILNWYKNSVDFAFNVPITTYHYKVTVRERDNKKRAISIDDFVRFTNALPWQLQRLAKIQFTYGLRIAEACALTVDMVDFGRKKIFIQQAIVWIKDVPSLKKSTKTEDKAEFELTPEAEMIFRELDAARPKSCRYFFHYNGAMPRYRPIVDAYKAALKEAGIEGVSGTHFVRHTAATISRKLGGIDAAQALLRHKSTTMAEHYAKLDVNEKASEVVIHAERLFLEASLKSRATNATSEDGRRKKSGS